MKMTATTRILLRALRENKSLTASQVLDVTQASLVYTDTLLRRMIQAGIVIRTSDDSYAINLNYVPPTSTTPFLAQTTPNPLSPTLTSANV